MSLTKEEINRLQLALGRDDCGLWRLRAEWALRLFQDSVKTPEGAAEAVAEAEMLLRELVK